MPRFLQQRLVVVACDHCEAELFDASDVFDNPTCSASCRVCEKCLTTSTMPVDCLQCFAEVGAV